MGFHIPEENKKKNPQTSVVHQSLFFLVHTTIKQQGIRSTRGFIWFVTFKRILKVTT